MFIRLGRTRTHFAPQQWSISKFHGYHPLTITTLLLHLNICNVKLFHPKLKTTIELTCNQVYWHLSNWTSEFTLSLRMGHKLVVLTELIQTLIQKSLSETKLTTRSRSAIFLLEHFPICIVLLKRIFSMQHLWKGKKFEENRNFRYSANTNFRCFHCCIGRMFSFSKIS